MTGSGNSLLNALSDDADGSGGSKGIWNDEEERRFYTDLLDLRGEVPGSLLNSAKDGVDASVKQSELIGAGDAAEGKEMAE